MKTNSLLIQIRPRCFARLRALPIFGPQLDDFLEWLQDQGYAVSTISCFVQIMPKAMAFS